MKYPCILFDLDGTLLDTIEDLADSVNYAMRKYGIPELSVATVRSYVGNGLENLMTRCIPDGYDDPRFWEIYREFKKYYLDHSCIKTKPYHGIIELLRKLSVEGRKMAVISNKNDKAVKELNNIFFSGIIDVAIGEQDGVRKKPYPDSVFHAMEQLGCTDAECVYIGDSEVDIITAKNACIPCISVAWGFRPVEQLIENGADLIAHTPDELYALL